MRVAYSQNFNALTSSTAQLYIETQSTPNPRALPSSRAISTQAGGTSHCDATIAFGDHILAAVDQFRGEMDLFGRDQRKQRKGKIDDVSYQYKALQSATTDRESRRILHNLWMTVCGSQRCVQGIYAGKGCMDAEGAGSRTTYYESTGQLFTRLGPSRCPP